MKRKLVRLSAREVLYLKNSRFLPIGLAQVVQDAEPADDGCVLSVSNDVAEEFRSEFTIALAKTGFDAAYDPTAEGKMLEELIDRFGLQERQ